MIQLYTLFHLNLMYSAIEESERKQVVERCYWPLLELAESRHLPLALELPGVTLEILQQLAPDWVAKLRTLLQEKKVELVGSGYCQLIGPLVPAKVNHWNQKLGRQTYRRVLHATPEVALVNELAYSAGILEHYLNNGYRAILMEWNNARSHHPEWPERWRCFPQKAAALDGRSIELIWLDCLAFQRFQRYAHGEDTLEEYLAFLNRRASDSVAYLSLYGNDAEIFDFRPGRYQTEAPLQQGEWARLAELFDRVEEAPHLALVPLSQVRRARTHPDAGHVLSLESAQQPVLVKKQPKYNLTRWAVTGRNDLEINTRCYEIYEHLLARGTDDPEAWRELCFLWSSDFRTHLTEKRWRAYLARLQRFYQKVHSRTPPVSSGRPPESARPDANAFRPFEMEHGEKFLTVRCGDQEVVFNLFRGLTLHSFTHRDLCGTPLLGTLPHGYFDEIELGADFYTGHTVIEIPGRRRLTDLCRVDAHVSEAPGQCTVRATVDLGLGTAEKSWTFEPAQNRLKLRLRLRLKEHFYGTVRTGFVTLHPESYDVETLFYRVHNGGHSPESFPLNHEPVTHPLPVSALISARQGLGCTEGWVQLGDARHQVSVKVARRRCAALPMVQYQRAGERFFFRLLYSLLELDETRLEKAGKRRYDFEQEISFGQARVPDRPSV